MKQFMHVTLLLITCALNSTSFASKAKCDIGNGIYSKIGTQSGFEVAISTFSKENWVQLKQKGYGRRGHILTLAVLNNMQLTPARDGRSMNTQASREYAYLHYPINVRGWSTQITLDANHCLPNGDCMENDGLMTHLSLAGRIPDAVVDLLPPCDEVLSSQDPE